LANDTRATAGDVVVGAASQRHRFCKPNDEDWVKFTVQAGASYTVRAAASGSQANPTLVGSYNDGSGTSVSGNPLQIRRGDIFQKIMITFYAVAVVGHQLTGQP
jgi:hypothetical protein